MEQNTKHLAIEVLAWGMLGIIFGVGLAWLLVTDENTAYIILVLLGLVSLIIYMIRKSVKLRKIKVKVEN